MNNSKNLLLIILLFLGFLLYTAWQKDYGPKSSVSMENNSDQMIVSNDLFDTPKNNVDTVPKEKNSTQLNEQIKPNKSFSDTPNLVSRNSVKIIAEVETEVLKMAFAEKGAALVYAELKKYPTVKGSSERVILLDYRDNPYFAQTGLVGDHVSFDHNLLFEAKTIPDKVIEGETKVEFLANHNGATIVKSYIIKPESYEIIFNQKVDNNTDTAWNLSEYYQLKRNDPWQGKESGFTDPGRMSFKGAGYFDPEEGYERKTFEDIRESSVNIKSADKSWIAMVQHYFLSAFIPEGKNIQIQTVYQNTETPYLIRAISPQQQVQPGNSFNFTSKFYVGPKIQKDLPKIAEGLELTVDYGIFTVFAKPLFWVLSKIHDFVGNWGWSIVLLTILIKLVFFKLSEKQYRSMAKMRKLQPRIKTLKERYKENRQKFNEEMMKLYQQEKVNPLGGCLPILIQIPIFIALYWVLVESVELRQAPFMLWIQDLSSPDPYFILPAINAAAMFMTQKLSPTPGMDPMQEKILKFMPLIFSFLFAFFQSGLVLYWAVNSVLSLIQQWVITKRVEQQP